MGEYICKQCDQQGINPQTAHVTQYQKNEQPNQKMDRRYTDGQEAHKKMLSITNY